MIKQSVAPFTSIEHIKPQHQLDLHLALKIMIKYHFNNEDEKRELLKMITKAVTETMTDELPNYERLKQENIVFKNTLIEMGKELSEKDKKLTEKDQQITESYQEIKKLKTEINKLKKE